MKIIFLGLLILASSFSTFGRVPYGNEPTLTPLANLEKAARAKTVARARLPLAASESVKEIKNADPLESGNAPNYLLALMQNTKSATQYARLVQTFLYDGALRPEIKMAMGLRVAQTYNSPYLYAHASRWLRASDTGQTLLKNMQANQTPAGISDAEKLALTYAELLSRDVHGVTDADFGKIRSVYNDSQIVELTLTVCFFNHFVRFVEALNLPVEDWVLDDVAKTPSRLAVYSPPVARVALITDQEIAATGGAAAASKEPQKPNSGLGIGMANSMRAMMRVPALAQAWREFGFQNRETWSIERNIQLQISFAVSNANGCRYCTLHQVLGLRRLGVDMKKLVAMRKDDSSLAPRELVAVEFVRKLTKEPASINDADFAKLKAEFGEQGAIEIILQTGGFAFMNRFTDNLRLPSEDEAVRIYQETYGDGSYKRDWKF